MIACDGPAADVEIADVGCHPEQIDVVADWVRAEWWARSSTKRSDIAAWIRAGIASDGFPCTLVALSAGRVVGSAFLHRSEAEDRPSFTPYLGALYVEPSFRGRGIGRSLVREVARRAATLGYKRLYLNAGAQRTSFYEALGWTVVESGYGPDRLNILGIRLADPDH